MSDGIFDIVFDEHSNAVGCYGGATLLHKYNFIKRWIDDNNYYFGKDDDPNILDGDKIKDLLVHTSNYTISICTKDMVSHTNKHINLPPSKTVLDLTNRMKKHLIAVTHDFNRLNLYEKGNELWKLIYEFTENPNAFVLPMLKCNANNQELREFLKSLGLENNPVNEYLDNFKPSQYPTNS
jgi:hypothetical protein